MKIKMEINRSMNQLKKMVGIFAGLAMLLSFSSFTSSSNNADAIVGVWKTGEGTAMVRIYKNGDKYQGKIVWLKEPNDPEQENPR